MSNYTIVTNSKRCISCKACEVHCKSKNGVPLGAKYGVHVSVGPMMVNDKVEIRTLFMPCFHCESPWCVKACPTSAMTRRESDGVVYVQQELCVGCKACIMACPWKIPQWNEATHKAIKCDYCRDRIDVGLKPACVTACTAHALDFTTPNEVSEKARAAYATQVLLHGAE